ncbi:MAG: helicase-related protein [Thermoplasmata archaeon]
MVKQPPHILITTPESFTLLLNSVRFQEHLKGVKYVILDEIHELCATKRGSLLSAELEFLEEIAPHFVRIGLSATQSPIEKIGMFLGGYSPRKPRAVEILNLETAKEYEVRIIYPEGIGNKGREETILQIARICAQIIASHKTVLIFTNTRKLTEEFVQVLRSLGIGAVDAHHGSLSRKRRLETEESLKKGELRAVVTSTSLELGIDIGSVDCVIQISSPKSISKAIQRFGRAGHTLGGISKGYFVATGIQDFLECLAILMKIQRRELDNVEIPEKPLDVLSQVLVGLGIHGIWKVKDVLRILRRSYTYHNLRKRELENVLDAISRTRMPLVHYEMKLEEFTTRRSVASAFYENVGTIPAEYNYEVIDEFGESLGTLSERFVEFLKPGETFVLGGRVYEFVRRTARRIFVKESREKEATIPSWLGELNARTWELSEAFKELLGNLGAMNEEEMRQYFHTYLENPGALDEIVGIIKRQQEIGVPDERRIVVETIVEGDKKATIVHSPHGRRVNEAIARYIARTILPQPEVTVDDNGLAIHTTASIEIVELLKSEDFEKVVVQGLLSSEAFRMKFKQCASRALILLTNLRGKRFSSTRISKVVEEILSRINQKNPIYREAIKETLEMVDIPGALQIIQELKEGNLELTSGIEGKLSPFGIEMLSNFARDSGILADKLKRIRGQAMLKKYLLGGAALSPRFENEAEALKFLQEYKSCWYPEENLEKLAREKKVHRVLLPSGTLYLSPDAFSLYSEFLALDWASGRKTRLAKMLIEILATAPFDVREFAMLLGISQPQVEKMLEELLLEGIIVGVIHNGSEKFLSARTLEFVMGNESEYLSQKEIKEIVAAKTLGVNSVTEYFENYIGVRDPYSLFARGIITAEEWESLLEKGEVVHGRFLGGRSVFVHARDLPLLQSLYATPLSPNEERVLKMLSQPMEFGEIRKKTGISSKLLREILERLEALVLIRRTGEPLKYLPIPKESYDEGKEEEVILRLVKGFGAVSVETLSRYLNLPSERVHAILNNLQAKKKIRRAKIIGNERTVFLADERVYGTSGTILLPLNDPYLEPKWAEIAGKYGDVNLVYVEKNEVAGVLSAETNDGVLEVHELNLVSDCSLENLGKWILGYGDYKKVLVVRLHSFSGLPSPLPGFTASNGKWVHSRVDYLHSSFSFRDLFPKLLTLQKIYRRAEHTLNVVQELWGVHNMEEVKLRARTPVDAGEIEGLYYVPGLSGNAYMSLEQMSIVRGVKNHRLAPEMQEILGAIGDGKDEEELYAEVPLSYRKFRLALGKMLKQNILYRDADGKLKAVPEINSGEATEKYIAHLVSTFGAVNPALISTYTKNVLGKGMALEVCTKLAMEGKCSVGFLLKEMDTLFYINPKILDVEDSDFTGVIPGEDRIVKFFQPLLKKISGFTSPYIIVSSGKIAGFVEASRKGKEIYLEDFNGDEEAWQIFREFLFARDYLLRKQENTQR